MKVLTIRQPWAELILTGGKDIENRTWKTSLRGCVAIHSSARLDPVEFGNASAFMWDRKLDPGDERWKLVLGHILGTVEIVDCVTESKSPWFFGPYGFVLRNPVLFEQPIPAKGKLGFWEWDERDA